MDQQKPSDALTEPRRPLRTAGIAAAGVAALIGMSFGGVALAQNLSQPETISVASESTDEPNVEPAASFSFLTVDGLTISVDGSNSIDPDGELVSYAWDFGDGQTADGATSSHAYGDYGTYTVTLTVTDDAGATGVFSADVTLDAPPPPPPPAPEPPATPGYTYGNYPPGATMPNLPGTDQPDTSACASSTGTADANGNPVCA